jgi:hypothetical protein
MDKPRPFFDEGAWRCGGCGGKITETSRRPIGVFTKPRRLLVDHVFGRCDDCAADTDWTETKPAKPS